MATDTLGLVPAVIVTAASVHDSTGGKRLLDELAASHPSVTKVWADGGSQNSVFQHGAARGNRRRGRETAHHQTIPTPGETLGDRADVRLADAASAPRHGL
ncbi:transposase [Streptomyces sp. NPDC001107]